MSFPVRKKLYSLTLSVFIASGGLFAADKASPDRVPVVITADGQVSYDESGVAHGERNVVIKYKDTLLIADKASYDKNLKIANAQGNVYLFRDGKEWHGSSAIYNFETKELTLGKFEGILANDITKPGPYKSGAVFYSGSKLESVPTGEGPGKNKYVASTALLSPSDYESPDTRVEAKTIEVFPDDKVVMRDVVFYVADVPVFYLPYFSKSLKDTRNAFDIKPGYSSKLGAYAIVGYNWHLNKNLEGTVHLNSYSKRGIGGGIDLHPTYGKDGKHGEGHIKTFIIEDQDSNIRNGRDTRFVEQTRYRVQVRQRNHITDDIAATFDINKWSDRHVTEDFFQREFAKEVQPDNVVDVTKYDPNYTVSLVSRLQMNDFFETVERMPELALDLKRQKIAKTNLNYEGETSVARLRRAFSDLPSPTSNGILQTRANTFPSDFDATRLDSFHQLSYPVAAWKWLNIVPRAGIRGTYYSDSPDATSIPGLSGSNDDVFRGAANTGVEFSFKMHKTWTDYQNSKLDIDGLRHIMQPSLNYSFVRVTKDPTKIFPFDSQLPSTRLAPIEFPQFRSIDSIDDQNVIRLGVRNKLQTRRGVYATDKTKENWDLIDWNTYYEVNIEKNPRRREGRLSDLYNEVTLKPLRWLTFELDTRTDLGQFNLDEVNTRTTFQVAGNFDLWMDTRYLNDDEFFQSTATFGPGFRYRMNEDWAVGMNWRLEAETGEIEDQEYSLYRDFPSWATSLTFRRVLNRGGEDDNQVFLTFTLKGFPSVTGSAGGSPSSSGSK